MSRIGQEAIFSSDSMGLCKKVIAPEISELIGSEKAKKPCLRGLYFNAVSKARKRPFFTIPPRRKTGGLKGIGTGRLTSCGMMPAAVIFTSSQPQGCQEVDVGCTKIGVWKN